MSFLQTTPFYISTLTPVHIGSGEDYEPGNYLIDKGWLYFFEPAKLAGQLDDRQQQKLLSIVDKENMDERALIELQNFFKNLSAVIKPLSQYQLPVPDGIEQFYKDKLGKVAQQEGRGQGRVRQKKVANKLEIERAVINHTSGDYYIPGSSVKGTIRSAIINALKTKDKLTWQEERDLSNRHKSKKLVQDLEKNTLDYQNVTEDPMKYLKVSDIRFVEPQLPQSTIQFCVNRKRKPTNKQSMAEQKGLYQILECIAANHYRSLMGEIRLQTDKDKQLSALGINSVQKLAQFCNQFYLPQLKQELDELNTLNLLAKDWYKTIMTLFFETLKEPLTNGSVMLLRLGKHGGALSKTLDGLRWIHIPQHKRMADKPTTIWLAADSQKQKDRLQPFGWVLLEWHNTASTHVLKEHLQQAGSILQEKLQQEIERQQEVAQEQQAKRLAEQQYEQQLREAEQQKQQALQQATKGLSGLAVQFAERKINEQWESDKNKFMASGLIESLLDELEQQPDKDAVQILGELVELHIKGLLSNPNATVGKKKKPKYKPRQQTIAGRLLKLMES